MSLPREIIFGIRPEDIGIHTTERTDSFRAEVYVVKYMGHENDIKLWVDNKIITCRVLVNLDVQIGERVWVTFDKKRLLLFDKMINRRVLPRDHN